MVLHIGNNRTVPRRDIVAVLDAKALRRALGAKALLGVDLCYCDPAAVRSVVVLDHGGKERRLASPISTAALRLRGWM